MDRSVDKEILNAKKIVETLGRLQMRIQDRFPKSGLAEVCRTLLRAAKETETTIAWVEAPSYLFRLLAVLVVSALVFVVGYALLNVEIKTSSLGLARFVQLSEAALNDVIILGAAVIFIVTFEARRKRKRVITALNKLRTIAHVIDTHQLTKDPDSVGRHFRAAKHSPKRSFTPHELSRYLSYCSEMLSLSSKVAFLYVQRFDDPVAVNAVNDFESLTTGLSRKIWQKIMILKSETSLEARTSSS